MPCKHLRELYEMCQRYNLRLSSTDLIRLVCPQCGLEGDCPSVLYEQYEWRHRGDLDPGDSTENAPPGP